MAALPPLSWSVAGGVAHVRFTTRADGDLNADLVPLADLARRRRSLAPVAQTWLDEVHGTEVITVTSPGHGSGATADAAVTAVPGAALGIWVGDCAPVALVGADGVVGAAHAGWKGLEAGVLARTVAAMRCLGAGEVRAVLGPCIRAECYEFGATDLDRLAATFGDQVRARTAWDTDALDLAAGIRAALAYEGVTVDDTGVCTACNERDYWSFRARADLARHGMLVWFERERAA